MFRYYNLRYRQLFGENYLIIHSIFFNEIQRHIYQGYIKATYRISFWSDIKELRYNVGKLTKNYEEKSILSHCDLDLWPRVTNFNKVRASAVCNHKIFSENCVQIDTFHGGVKMYRIDYLYMLEYYLTELRHKMLPRDFQ